MKKILALLLTLVMLLSLTGCEEILGIAMDVGPGYLETMNANDSTEDQTVPDAVPSANTTVTDPDPTTEPPPDSPIDVDGWYYSKEDVALYLYTYGKLPGNFITKSEAQALGWEGGSVDRYKKGAAIGGDRFGNYEGLLPKASGRVYYECDIDTEGKSRGAKRIVFSNDGLIYYTDDHYESFTLLYGEE